MKRLQAVCYGIVCHASFAAAVGLILVGIFTGLTIGQGRLTGVAAWIANGLLIAQFPLLHSWLLSPRGRPHLARFAPAGLEWDLTSTLFATVASWQLIAAFALWSPTGIVLWQPSGSALVALTAAYAGSWLLLGKAMLDAGIGIQTGARGWWAVFRGRRAEKPSMPSGGLFRACRQPIYLAFALIMWTAPTWTADRVVLALAWTAYCVLGPLHKERRYLRRYGGQFAEYRRTVPYLLPFFRHRP